MRQLRGDLDTAVAARRQRALPLQRLRTLLQDERDQQAARQTKAKDGKQTGRIRSIRHSRLAAVYLVAGHTSRNSSPSRGAWRRPIGDEEGNYDKRRTQARWKYFSLPLPLSPSLSAAADAALFVMLRFQR